MNYAKQETELFRLTTMDGDEDGCAYYPLTMIWKGKHIPYAHSASISVRGYEAKIEITLTPLAARGYKGNPADEAIWADMRAAGIVVRDGDGDGAGKAP